MTVKGVNGPAEIPEDPKANGAQISAEDIQDSIRAYIKDRLGNIANRIISGDEKTAVNDLGVFINVITSDKTKFYHYADDLAGSFLITSNKEFDSTETGRNNPVYIGVTEKVTELKKEEVEKAVDLEKVKAKLGRVKAEIEANGIDLFRIGEITDRMFSTEQIQAKNS